MKTVTVGIPAYKAEKHICDCLSSVQTQTAKEEIAVVIASDSPNDDYGFVKKRFPDLDITILPCEKNTGAGLARQRALDACKTEWITFIDADDVFFTPFSIEQLMSGVQPNVIEVQAPFLQETGKLGNFQIPRMVPRNDVSHPWVFGRLYNVSFLKTNKIEFSELRAINYSVA